MKEWINKKWKEGFFITSVAGGDGSYVVVASKVIHILMCTTIAWDFCSMFMALFV